MLLGQIIEERTAEGAMASIESLIKLTPNKARRVIGEQEEEVPAQNLSYRRLHPCSSRRQHSG